MTRSAGWERRALGGVAALLMGQSPDSKFYSDQQVGLPFLQGCAEFGSRFPHHALYCSQSRKVAPAGSILFSVRAPVGKLNIADRDFIIGRGLAAIVGSTVTQGYLEHYLRYEESRFRVASQGSTFEAINLSELNRWPIDFPTDAAEQSKIAEVLSTVDRAIEQTETRIAKWRRIKTGLMQDLLTHGIDKHGNLRSEQTHEFKDSPLGQIPVGWEVAQLGRVSEFVTSGARGWARYYREEGAVFLRIGNLTREHVNLRLSDLVFVQPPPSVEGRRTSVEPGDLLISVTADLGIVGVVPDRFGGGYVNQHIALVRLDREQVHSRFVAWFLSSPAGQAQFNRLNESGAKAGLNLPTVRSLLFARPDPDEQQRIASTIDASVATLDMYGRSRRKLVALKAGLMQDLLTGERRVTALLPQPGVAST